MTIDPQRHPLVQLAVSSLPNEPLAPRLAAVMALPTGMTSAGYPYLERQAWELFRDGVPHLFGMGLKTHRLAQQLAVMAEELDGDDRDNAKRAAQVVRQVVFTATITAPTDLWLMRWVLGSLASLGLRERLLEGEAIYPDSCWADGGRLDAAELDADLLFLLSRGVVEQYDNSFRVAGHPRVAAMLRKVKPTTFPAAMTGLWRRAFMQEVLGEDERRTLVLAGHGLKPRSDLAQNHWVPTLEEIEIGYRLVPVVLGLRAAELTETLAEVGRIAPRDVHDDPEIGNSTVAILTAAGWLEDHQVTSMGRRGLARAPGPFGIIETYHPYMARGTELLCGDRQDVWVRRGENVGASQDANRRTFARAHDALDRFCADTGFRYRVFIEHAIGRGEATRQRWERSGDTLRYFGADLEDDAINAAVAEQAAGKLPGDMVFVRRADIGQPQALIDAIVEAGADPSGAVMFVGNGFHEVRDQTDERMVEVFRKYHDAGIVLVFTEENALSIDDLRATAFNTYHAGFKYVHEKSGQGLRPAHERPVPRLGRQLRAAWSECAAKAGYIRMDDYCSRTRTIYPYTPPSGHNPSISVGHFVVPRSIAVDLE